MVVRPARLVFERPTASFSFDDFPRSAFEAGAPILERYGAKATYYAAGTFCGGRADGLDYYDEAMLRAVAAAGHEVGCHSFSHGHAHGRRIGHQQDKAGGDRDAEHGDRHTETADRGQSAWPLPGRAHHAGRTTGKKR